MWRTYFTILRYFILSIIKSSIHRLIIFFLVQKGLVSRSEAAENLSVWISKILFKRNFFEYAMPLISGITSKIIIMKWFFVSLELIDWEPRSQKIYIMKRETSLIFIKFKYLGDCQLSPPLGSLCRYVSSNLKY
jgi:hypothetical protein